MTNDQNANPILNAIRLGWLSVEAFGYLRWWSASPHKRPAEVGKQTQRFTFSDRDPSQHDQLLITLLRLKATAAQLLPALPPPIPDDPAGLLDKANQDINAVWVEFETWGREAWNALQVVDPLAGQAFTYGGSLADTYWHARGSGADELNNLLRAQRLESIANRFDSIAGFLPDHAAEVIHHTLYRWRIAGRLKDLDEPQKKRLLDRLEAQARVWHDLLFGLQRAQDYLRREDRRWVVWGAFGATVLLVILVGLATWLAVLLLSRTGRSLLASAPGTQGGPADSGSLLAAELFNWQNWASLLATLASVVVIFTGFITRLSGWMIAFHRWVYNRLLFRQIIRRTYRSWESP